MESHQEGVNNVLSTIPSKYRVDLIDYLGTGKLSWRFRAYSVFHENAREAFMEIDEIKEQMQKNGGYEEAHKRYVSDLTNPEMSLLEWHQRTLNGEQLEPETDIFHQSSLDEIINGDKEDKPWLK
jgi:hypothetical protein